MNINFGGEEDHELRIDFEKLFVHEKFKEAVKDELL